MKNNYLMTVIISIVFSGIGFFCGTRYQQIKPQAFTGQFNNRQGMMRNISQNGMNRGGFRPVAGEIISIDDKSITVKLQDESSKIIFINDKTQINKAATVNKSELKVGEKISVFGSENTDGSVTAQNVQLNPIQMGQRQPTDK